MTLHLDDFLYQSYVNGFMPDAKQLFNDLKERLSRLDRETDALGRDEKEELEHLSKGDLEGSIEIFSEEVELADSTADDLKDLEDEELEVEELFSEGKISGKLAEKFKGTEQKFEDILEEFIEEMNTLRNEAESLRKDIRGSNVSEERREEFAGDFEKLKQVIGEVEELEQEGQIVMERRKFMKGAAAVAAGASVPGGKNVDPRKEALKLERKTARSLNSGTKNTKKQVEREDSQVSRDRGEIEEQLTLERQGIKADIELIRTSADTGLTITRLENVSDTETEVQHLMIFQHLMVNGAVGVDSSAGGQFSTNLTLSPREVHTSGAMVQKIEDAPSVVNYRIFASNEEEETVNEEKIGLDFPNDIVSQNVVDTSKIPGLDVEFNIKGMQNAGRRLEVHARNTSSEDIIASISIGVPGGWSYSGGENIQQSAAGIINTKNQLGKGEDDYIAASLHMQDSNAPVIANVSITVFPVGHPEDSSSYLLPIDLRH